MKQVLAIIEKAEQHDGTKYDHSPDYYRGWEDACERIGEAVEELGDGWISVEDRLPPPGIDTLVYGQDGMHVSCYGELGSYFGKRAKEMGWGDGQDEQPGILNVSHWQPLLNPPTK